MTLSRNLSHLGLKFAPAQGHSRRRGSECRWLRLLAWNIKRRGNSLWRKSNSWRSTLKAWAVGNAPNLQTASGASCAECASGRGGPVHQTENQSCSCGFLELGRMGVVSSSIGVPPCLIWRSLRSNSRFIRILDPFSDHGLMSDRSNAQQMLCQF